VIVDPVVQVRISIEKLATTIMKLAHMSKEADKIVKSAREWESKTLNNEVEIEELDKQMREARRIGRHKAFFRDSLTRVASLGFS
jgi:DNA-binding IclR family transcriptional regulator